MNQQNLSKWLKCITVLVTCILTFLLFFLIPSYGRNIVCMNPEFSGWYMPWLLFIWLLGVPCYIVLLIFWGICNEIRKDNSFSMKNAKALAMISKLAMADSFLCFLGMVAFSVVQIMHFSVFIIGIMVVIIGIAIAVIAAALGHLVQKASKMKEENDLTI
ncbi:DUF2975 domain-containing protein [Anaerosporobacter sp.]|uniref:DUF2975 domain-containing protein n=1 Tax=Anaerosporobacter sp. TaxID=1872529 RepID=UPI00286F979E|nr:DUF2975 domain-containing protein [Anaerosporobacter sp.]